MARELILVPKLKYEQLLEVQTRQSNNNTSLSIKHTGKKAQQSEESMESKEKMSIEENKTKKEDGKNTQELYVKMKPDTFLADMKTETPMKNKWLAFKL